MLTISFTIRFAVEVSFPCRLLGIVPRRNTWPVVSSELPYSLWLSTGQWGIAGYLES